MALREFTDGNGVVWRVVEIVPRWAERRKRTRRTKDSTPSEQLQRIERRRRPDRRRVDEVRAPVTPGYEQGWLAFESATEKRRIAPPPSGWAALSPEKLELLCRLARPVLKRHGRLIE